jgi:GNAT superfamily N-acetyltransferase
MKIIHKDVSDLTPVEYRACHKANFGENGYMREVLVACKGGNAGKVVMLWNGPDNTARSLIGWALLTPVTPYGILSVSRWVMQRSKYTAEFWVKPRYRRKGYGKVLMNEVKKYDSNPHVIPHDTASSELFSAYNVQVLKYDKIWLRNKPRVA